MSGSVLLHFAWFRRDRSPECSAWSTGLFPCAVGEGTVTASVCLKLLCVQRSVERSLSQSEALHMNRYSEAFCASLEGL